MKTILYIGTILLIVLFVFLFWPDKIDFLEPVVSVSSLVIVGNNSLVAISSPTFPDVRIFGILIKDSASIYRKVTAWNAVPEQTDSTPCISASGMDICKALNHGINIAASNEFPFGTYLWIPELNKIYEVQDRTNSRYKYRIDLLFKELDDAIIFGIKTLEIYPLTI